MKRLLIPILLIVVATCTACAGTPRIARCFVEPGSLVLDLLNHRVRSGDERARRRRAVAGLRRGRGGAVREARRWSGRDAGGGESACTDRKRSRCSNRGSALKRSSSGSRTRIPGRDTRQVGVIDAKGRSAVYTGKHVIDRNFDAKDPVHYGGYAGHVTGKNFSVQGNTLASEAVVKAIAEAYEHGTGSMADRFMDALDAGQSKGGDMRGMQSAGMLVVKPIPPNSESTVERIVDIRVDDATNPFVELRRLLQITEGVPAKLTEHAAQLAKEGKFKEAIAEQQKAIAITPNNEQLHYALAQRYAQAGQFDDAVKSLEVAVHKQAYFKKRAAEDPLFAKMKELAAFRRLVG